MSDESLVQSRGMSMTEAKKAAMSDVVMIRLAQSGRRQAKLAAQALREAGFTFIYAYSSRLKRARQSAEIILQQMGHQGLPITDDWRSADSTAKLLPNADESCAR